MSGSFGRRALLQGIGIGIPVIDLGILPSRAENRTVSAMRDRQCRTINASNCSLSATMAASALNEVLMRGHSPSNLRWRFGIAGLASVEAIYFMYLSGDDVTEALKKGVSECLEYKFLGIPFVFEKSDLMACSIEGGPGFSDTLAQITNIAIPKAVDDIVTPEREKI